MIGAWIDSLTDEQRDRIIEHPDPTNDGDYWWSPEQCGCLVGCVLEPEVGRLPGMWSLTNGRLQSAALNRGWFGTGMLFADSVNRFGAERMWRVVKARAAKRNSVVTAPGVLVEA